MTTSPISKSADHLQNKSLPALDNTLGKITDDDTTLNTRRDNLLKAIDEGKSADEVMMLLSLLMLGNGTNENFLGAQGDGSYQNQYQNLVIKYGDQLGVLNDGRDIISQTTSDTTGNSTPDTIQQIQDALAYLKGVVDKNDMFAGSRTAFDTACSTLQTDLNNLQAAFKNSSDPFADLRTEAGKLPSQGTGSGNYATDPTKASQLLTDLGTQTSALSSAFQVQTGAAQTSLQSASTDMQTVDKAASQILTAIMTLIKAVVSGQISH